MRLQAVFLPAIAVIASLIVAVTAAVAVGMLAEKKRKRPLEEDEEEEEELPPVPITVVSGFLGTGKTTLLNNMLTKAEGLQIGVIVNDLAEVNVDARLIRQVDKGAAVESFAELQNGCVCCSAGDDLLAAVERALEGRKLDHVLIECSGMAQPENIVEVFKRASEAKHPVMKKVILDTMVSVVDTDRVLSWLDSDGGKAKGAAFGSHEQQQALVKLFLSQIECADVVVVNKADKVLASQVTRCRSAVSALNANASVVSASYSVVPLESVLGTGRRQPKPPTNSAPSAVNPEPADASSAPPPAPPPPHPHSHESHPADHVHHPPNKSDDVAAPSLTPPPISPRGRTPGSSTQPGGVWSFVYVARRPFHPERLGGLLRAFRGALSEASGGGALSSPSVAGGLGTSGRVGGEGGDASSVLKGRAMWGVLRSKGLVWVATSMEKAREWSQAAGVLEIQHGPAWWSALPVEKWPERREVRADIMRKCKGAKYGDRRQEIVFIGTPAMQEGLIRMSLDRCLLTDKEMGGGPSKWEQMPDPIALSLSPAVRAQAESGSASHGRSCPCCDPELRDMEKFAFGVGF